LSGLGVMVSVCGVVPVSGLTVSQGPLMIWTEMPTVGLEEMTTVLDGGGWPPEDAVKSRTLAVEVSAGAPVIIRVMVMSTELAPTVDKVMVPR